MNILDTIVAHKRFEIAAAKADLTEEMLKEHIANRKPRSMKKALIDSKSGIIAEFKRRSPSKGWLSREAKVEDIIPIYSSCGAAACSVLADKGFFGGSAEDVRSARAITELPILYKEFIIDPYQLLLARSLGADAVLLISSVLSATEIEKFSNTAHELGLEVLLEIHNASELYRLSLNIDMLGVNNRNLGTFRTSVENSISIAKDVQQHVSSIENKPLLISESGIKTASDIKILRDAGYSGFLIGEAFMSSSKPGEVLKSFAKESML